MALDISKAYSNLKTTIYENRKVNTTPRSFTEDIFLIPTATELTKQEILLQYIQALQSFESIKELLNSTTKLQLIADALNVDVSVVETNIATALDKLAANYAKTRKEATKTTGTVSFWRSTPVSSSELTSTIAIGTLVASTTTGIQYKTTAAVSYSNYYTDLTFGTNGYMLDVPVECAVAGSVGNTVIDDITSVITSVSGFPYVTNKLAFSNGTDEETSLDFATRMQNEISGSRMGTQNGLKAFILQNTAATDVTVVGAGDVEMVRDRGEGGCFDVYVKDIVIGSTTTTFSMQSANKYVFLSGARPVINNSSAILESYGSIAVTMHRDTTSIYKNSTLGKDWATFSQALQPNVEYTLTYTYNTLPDTIATLLALPENNTGADILVREATAVPVDLVFRVVSTSDESDVKEALVNTLITNIKAYIAELKLGDSLEQSDIINLCYIDGIDRVVLPMTYFRKTSDTINTTVDVISVDKTSYIVLGNLTITI